MAGKGGYQPPANPAPVSGPGKLARRTDGRPTQAAMPVTGLPYGDNQELANLQKSAPLAGPSAGVPKNATPIDEVLKGHLAQVNGSLDAPTARPNEPITAGAAYGPGPGPEVLPTPPLYQEGAASEDPVRMAIANAFRAFPSARLQSLLEQVDQGRGQNV